MRQAGTGHPARRTWMPTTARVMTAIGFSALLVMSIASATQAAGSAAPSRPIVYKGPTDALETMTDALGADRLCTRNGKKTLCAANSRGRIFSPGGATTARLGL